MANGWNFFELDIIRLCSFHTIPYYIDMHIDNYKLVCVYLFVTYRSTLVTFRHDRSDLLSDIHKEINLHDVMNCLGSTYM